MAGSRCSFTYQSTHQPFLRPLYEPLSKQLISVLGPSELIQLWMRLPAANRQRLLWLLSQLLEHQLSAAAAQGEDSDESAPRH